MVKPIYDKNIFEPLCNNYDHHKNINGGKIYVYLEWQNVSKVGNLPTSVRHLWGRTHQNKAVFKSRRSSVSSDGKGVSSIQTLEVLKRVDQNLLNWVYLTVWDHVIGRKMGQERMWKQHWRMWAYDQSLFSCVMVNIKYDGCIPSKGKYLPKKDWMLLPMPPISQAYWPTGWPRWSTSLRQQQCSVGHVHGTKLADMCK